MQTYNYCIKLIGLSLMLLALSTLASGYVKSIPYKNTIVKIYDEKANRAEIFSLLDRFPREYYDGIGYIKFHSKKHPSYCGLYWWGGNGIDLFGEMCWTKRVLAHELAHDKQFTEGDTFTEAYNHIGGFDKFEEEILQEAKE